MDKPELIEVAKGFYECGFKLMGTGRTYDIMKAAGLPAEKDGQDRRGTSERTGQDHKQVCKYYQSTLLSIRRDLAVTAISERQP